MATLLPKFARGRPETPGERTRTCALSWRARRAWTGSGCSPCGRTTSRWTVEEPDNRYGTFRSCRFILAASGTVTLETALIGTPVIVAYELSPLSAMVGRWLINVKFISLPNLIMDRAVYPELIQEEATVDNMVRAATRWLDDPKAYAEAREDLAGLRRLVGEPGAAERAASIIIGGLKGRAG